MRLCRPNLNIVVTLRLWQRWCYDGHPQKCSYVSVREGLRPAGALLEYTDRCDDLSCLTDPFLPF